MKLKKLSAIVILLFIVSFPNSIKADDEIIDLTIDDAYSKAVSYSSELKNIDEELYLANKDYDTARENLTYATDGERVLNLAVQLKETKNTLDNYDANSDIQKQNIYLSVLNFFIEVKKAEQEIELNNESLLLQEKKLKIADTKMELGLLSQQEYNDIKNSYDKMKIENDNLKLSIDNAYISLNKVLGAELNQKYNLILKIDYNKLDDVNVDTVVLKATATNQNIIELQNSAELAEYKVTKHSVYTSSESKEVLKAKAAQASRSVNDAKDSLKEKIVSTYNQIINIENSYDSNILELKDMNNKLKIKETEYSLGNLTEIELEEYKYSIKELEIKIQNQIYDHEILVMKFNNTNLL